MRAIVAGSCNQYARASFVTCVPMSDFVFSGLKVIDCATVIAAPVAAMILADFGADVIKIERAGVGDDTRKFAPPYIKDHDGNDTTESAYFSVANRNKRSVTLAISKPERHALAQRIPRAAPTNRHQATHGADASQYALDLTRCAVHR